MLEPQKPLLHITFLLVTARWHFPYSELKVSEITVITYCEYICWVWGESCLRAVRTAQLYHSSMLERD